MDDWLDRFADALGVARLAPGDVDTLLDLARVVAHGTERKNAPLAAYLAGRASVRAGHDPAAALGTAEELLGPASGSDPTQPGS